MSGSTGPTEMVHLSKFAAFHEENNREIADTVVRKGKALKVPENKKLLDLENEIKAEQSKVGSPEPLIFNGESGQTGSGQKSYL